MKPALSPYQNQRFYKEENYRPIISDEHDTKIFNKMLANWILKIHLKDHTPQPSGIYSRDAKIVQFLQVKVIYQVNNKKTPKIYDLHNVENVFDKIQLSFVIKTVKHRYKRLTHQDNKGYVWQTHS